MAPAHKRLACLAILSLMMVFALGATPARAAIETDTLQKVSFEDHGTFERAVITLGYGKVLGELAPTFSSSYRVGDSIARVRLPAVTPSPKTEGAGLARAISRYYVVRSPGTAGSLFVDFHLKGAARSVNVYKLDNPARIVIDVTPGGTMLAPRPATGMRTVVTEPRARNLAGRGTFIVRGYGRPPEARGAWRIKNASGRVVRKGTYKTSDWAATWGAFGFSASYPTSLSGKRGTRQVGEFSAKDGRFRGVSVPLKFR